MVAFGILWFFITLSVESSVIPIADVIFEHRVYLPSVGGFISLSSAVFTLADKFPVKIQKATISFLIVIVMVLAGATYMRNNVWQSPISLWEDASKKSPGNIRPFFTLGAEYAKVGKYERAIEMYLKALAVPPKEYLSLQTHEYPKVYNSLGMLYAQLGRYDEAVAVFSMILKIDPGFLDAYNNLGAALINRGRYAEAIAPLRHVIEKKPDHLDSHYNLALCYLATGSRNEAAEEYAILKKLSPELASELDFRIARDRELR